MCWECITKMKDSSKTEFSVGNFRIDMLRSQVVAQDNIIAMQPKVLQVLLLLAKNQGQVVSHEKLHASVWPDTQVEANALQRCIAQLRKVFGDDAKQQKYIVTHPKIGYSLVAQVDWPSPLKAERENTRNNKIPVVAGLVLTVLFALLVWLTLGQSPSELPLNRLKVLTATDNKEFSPVFSPDGQTIVFQRFVGGCKSQFYLLNLADNKEVLLTESPGIYAEPAWSPDGRYLVYTNAPNCDMDLENSGCRELQMLPVTLAKVSAAKGTTLVACQSQSYFSPVWLNELEVAFLAGGDKGVSIKRFDIHSAKTTDINMDINQPYKLLHAEGVNKLIVLQRDALLNNSMQIYDLFKGHVTQTEIAIPAQYKSIISWSAAWHSTKQTILMAAKGLIFEIALDGRITEHTVANYNDIDGLAIAPDSFQIAASIGKVDTDIGVLQNADYQILSRTNRQEREAQFQPAGEHIAFLSDRSISSQIWLMPLGQSNTAAIQLTFSNNHVDSYLWSADGRSLLYTSAGQLFIVGLNGEEQLISTKFQVKVIYQRLADGKFLLGILDKGISKVVSLRLTDGSIEQLYAGDIRWAQLSEEGALYLTQPNAQFAKVVEGQVSTLEAMTSTLAWRKFFYRDNQLIFLDDQRRIMSFDIASQTPPSPLTFELDVHQVSDLSINMYQILYSNPISSEREIVLFQY